MLHFEVLIFVFALSIPTAFAQWSPFECGNVQEWSTIDDDNLEAMYKFQKWIFSWQHTCEKNVYAEIPVNGDFGYSLNSAAMNMITSIELNLVYRPSGSKGILQWLWADDSPDQCSLEQRTVDCFFEPLSSCTMEQYDNPDVIRSPRDPPLKESERESALWIATAGDVCSISKVFKKPIQWVHGQNLHYLMRPNQRLMPFIMDRVKQIYGGGVSIPGNIAYADAFEAFKNDDRLRKGAGTVRRRQLLRGSDADMEMRRLEGADGAVIGLHIAADTVLQFEGQFLPEQLDLAPYIAAVDKKAHDLRDSGREVHTVYVCSDHQGPVLGTEEELNTRFPRSYKFKLLPHYTPSGADSAKILDLELRKRSSIGSDPVNKDLVMEYLADIEILALADVFIGGHSYFYSVVAGLRIARYYDVKGIHESTCLVDSDKNLFCENDQRAHELWVNYFNGYVHGTPF